MRLLGLLALCAAAAAAQDPLNLARLGAGRAYRSSSNNTDPASNDDSKRPIPGETVVLADLEGPGVVQHIWLTIAANEYGWPRLLRLRVYYDHSETPSVDAPVGDFFGVGHGNERPLRSLMVVNGSEGRSRNSYWAMPFRKACRITITNEGRRRVSNLYYHVDWERRATLPPATGYFHAWYHQDLPAKEGQPYEVLNVKGRGQYVGTLLNVVQVAPGWFGEGDDHLFLDGEKTASIQGTGTEDYFNDAWSLRVSDGPYWGVTAAEGTGRGSRMSAYRWHVRDPIPFQKSLRFEFEHGGWTYNTNGTVRSAFEERADLFSSVAFWYQMGIAEGLPEVPYGSARLPHGNAQQIEAETLVGAVETKGGSTEVQKEVFWGRDLLFFRAEGLGSRMEIPLDVVEDGYYEIVAQVAHAPDYGDYRALLDGAAVMQDGELEHEPGANVGDQTAWSGWGSELYVAEDRMLGWRKLTKGRHWLAFECAGKDMRSRGFHLGLDGLILAKVGQPQAVRPPSVPKSVDGMVSQLKTGDAVERGVAALALRDLGAGAKAALPALAKALQDRDTGVRMTAADAIARQGHEALVVMDALITAGEVKGEDAQVQRSVAIALGGIGPDAAKALSMLAELEKIPRVQATATTAMRQIRSKQ